ncbi:hypothetical protein BD413DRAFT_194329 [Trametes elegans]|nr:hypothetical protein BD413DRAFT_194329 [Trametes elegans]
MYVALIILCSLPRTAARMFTPNVALNDHGHSGSHVVCTPISWPSSRWSFRCSLYVFPWSESNKHCCVGPRKSPTRNGPTSRVSCSSHPSACMHSLKARGTGMPWRALADAV